MKRVIDILKKIFLIELIKGHILTGWYMLTPAVTRQYPKVKRRPFPGFRGLLVHLRYEDGRMKCVGCGLCVAACPSECIYLETAEDRDHNKVVVRYDYELARCVFCEFCVEACPVSAIAMTEVYELSNYTRQSIYYTKEMMLEAGDKYVGRTPLSQIKKYAKELMDKFIGHAN